MNLKYLIRLDREHINLIRKLPLVENSFQNGATLFYEGQVPIVAYLIVEGAIELFKNRRIKTVLKAGALIGLKELMQNSPVPLEAKVGPNTQLIYIDKSTVHEIVSAGYGSDLSLIFRGFIES